MRLIIDGEELGPDELEELSSGDSNTVSLVGGNLAHEESDADVESSSGAGTLPDVTGTETAQLQTELAAGDVVNRGVINARLVDPDAPAIISGGRVQLQGNRIAQAGEIRADGKTGDGGQILIYGDEMVVLKNFSITSADGGPNGDGGQIIIFADNHAHVGETLTLQARGGAQDGAGGFIETSGLESFHIGSTPDVTAPAGPAGTWLIDPHNITINNMVTTGIDTNDNTDPLFWPTTANNAVLNIDTLIAGLMGGASVEIMTATGGNPNQGDITLAADLDYNDIGTGGTLTLNAARDIDISGRIYDSNAMDDNLSVTLLAGRHIDIDEDIHTRGGDVILNAELGGGAPNGRINQTGGSIDTGGGTVSFSAGANVTLDEAQNRLHVIEGVTSDGSITIVDQGDLVIGDTL
ncbi:MAG: hypothetical protein AAF492_27095, partial [Verrucomicrobiota bacterium]